MLQMNEDEVQSRIERLLEDFAKDKEDMSLCRANYKAYQNAHYLMFARKINDRVVELLCDSFKNSYYIHATSFDLYITKNHPLYYLTGLKDYDEFLSWFEAEDDKIRLAIATKDAVQKAIAIQSLQELEEIGEWKL